MGKVIAILVFVLALGGGFFYLNSWDRVDPGNIGILVDYGDGSIDPVTETKWIWIGRYQKLVEWPAGQQSYVMERGDSVGQIKGDDSIPCRTSDTQNVNFDAQVDWRIDPKQIVQVYQLRKDVPLIGPKNREAPGNYLEDVVIRTALRDAITKTCPEYTWSDLLGVKQTAFQAEIAQKVKATAEPQGAIISAVTILRPYPSKEVEALLQARLAGQSQEEQSRFQAAQQKREQEIALAASLAQQEQARVAAEAKARADIAASNAAAEKNRIDTEARNRLLIANAETTAHVEKVKADQEAEAIRVRGEAEAASQRAQASAITPVLVDLERAKRWNGQMPTTMFGETPTMVNQIPITR